MKVKKNTYQVIQSDKENGLIYKMLGLEPRTIVPNTYIHVSVKERYEKMKYDSKTIKQFLKDNGGWVNLVD